MQHIGVYEDMRASSPDFPTTCEIHGCGTISCEKIAEQVFMTVSVVPNKQKR